MRNAETVLNVIRDRGKRGLPLEDLYRQLFNPDLYLRAYGRIYRNAGAMTPGTTEETVDAMSMAKIATLIDQLRQERYRWTPVRRINIPKRKGGTRPLGIPIWSDKLLQEVVRSLLEAYYEPQFSDRSHGFRPAHGCHTALMEVSQVWTGTRWFIEADVTGCFDNIDHGILLSILGEKIHDNRFLRLLQNLLQAGYLEQWVYHRTPSGSPQGGIVSPILSNIYLDKLDKFVEQTLLPEYTRGQRRRKNPMYNTLWKRAVYRRKQGRVDEAKGLRKQLQRLPSQDTHDPNYRRLFYVRYADDFLLGFAGPKAEAEEIKDKLKTFLHERLKLQLSEQKTLITHASTEAARFLGYQIVCQQCDTKHDRNSRRVINGKLALRLPADVIAAKCALYQRVGKTVHRPEMRHDSDFSIMRHYQSEYQGLVNYYLLAQNVCWLGKLRWIMELSLLKTLAGKFKSSVAKMVRKYQSTVSTPAGPRKCLECQIKREGKEPLVARFGGIPLRQQKGIPLVDYVPPHFRKNRTEIVKRLLAEECELCGSTQNVEVHHVRKLADLKVKGRGEVPAWITIMASRRRKTLVVCRSCHNAIHSGKPVSQPIEA